MIQGCIFDLDGTLTATLRSIAVPCNRTLRHFGLPAMPEENYRFYVGDGLDNALRRALRDAGDPEGRFFPEAIILCRRWFGEDPLFEVRPYEGIPELLSALKSAGVRLAVCSNKPHDSALRVVETIFGPGIFDAVQGQSDTVPIKPDPRGLLAILKKLGLRKQDCLYFGDSNTDMYTARNAGITPVGVTWGFRPRQELLDSGAEHLVDHPGEILTLIESGVRSWELGIRS